MDEEMPLFGIVWEEFSIEQMEEISTTIDKVEKKKRQSTATATRDFLK